MLKIFLILTLTMSTSIFSIQHSPLETVDYVDLDRYVGKWHEIARLPQKFQKGCVETTATYEKRKNGSIKVINECRLGEPNGKLKRAIGRAWVKDKNSNAKLKVQFFLHWFRLPFLAGDYWIIELAQDYSYVMIGEPSRKSLWILARSKQMDDQLYQDLVNRANDKGFNTSNLIKAQ